MQQQPLNEQELLDDQINQTTPPHRTQTLPPNSTVRRRLFPSNIQQEDIEEQDVILAEQIDEARLENALNIGAELLSRDRDEMKQKWNFDFETETPLEGQWEWEAVVAEVGGHIEDGSSEEGVTRDGRTISSSDIDCDTNSK